MIDSIHGSSRDIFFIAIPIVFMLFMRLFHLDETLARPTPALSRRRPARGMTENGEPILRDPDGRLVEPRRPYRR